MDVIAACALWAAVGYLWGRFTGTRVERRRAAPLTHLAANVVHELHHTPVGDSILVEYERHTADGYTARWITRTDTQENPT